MIVRITAISVLSLALPLCAFACPPAGYTNEQLLQIKENNFSISDDAQRNSLAISLLECLSEPNPSIRDEVAFEGLSSWLRAQSLTGQTIDSLYAGLVRQIASTNGDDGFQQPFAALTLSEVARTDRVEESFSDERRAELVKIASAYLRGVTDYRGFSETEGWRHGVAHGSDLVLQLVLNEHINREQIATLMDAVGAQVAPAGETFYRYGEPARLARAVFYAHQRGELDAEAWKSWFNGLANPAPFESWLVMFKSQAGLAKRHNTLAFLMAIHLNAVAAEDELGASLAEIAMDTLREVLGG